jgi:uncharacterized protein YegL
MVNMSINFHVLSQSPHLKLSMLNPIIVSDIKSLSSVLKEEIKNTIGRVADSDNSGSSFIEKVTNMYTLAKIAYSEELSGTNKSACPWKVVICTIDFSGSTANFDNGGGRSSRFQNQEDEVVDTSKVITKPIILAEIECTMQTLRMLMLTFNMSGTKLVVQPFSSSFCVFDHIIESNKDLCAVINNNFEDLPYECGGTELVKPLQYLAKEYFTENNMSLVILATDGQPSDKDGVYAILKQYRKMFNLIVIGAGSIGLNATNNLCFRGRHVSDIKLEALQTLVSIGALSELSVNVIQNVGNKQRSETTLRESFYSECDIEYLKKLVNDENVTAGLYVGAHGDYSEAIDDVDNFLKLVCDSEFNSTKKFGIILDNMLPKKYDDFVQTTLLSGHYVVMRAPNNAFYLVTPKWQIAIDNPFGCNTSHSELLAKQNLGNTIDMCVIADLESNIPNLLKMSYEDLYNLKLTDATKVITLIKPNHELLKTTMSFDNRCYMKMREVHYS